MLKRLLRFVAMVLFFVAVLVTATPVLAESREWRADVPKQGVGGFSLCIGEASAGPHRYRNVNYIDNEILANCDRYAREDVVRGFKFMWGIDLEPASVKVTVSRP